MNNSNNEISTSKTCQNSTKNLVNVKSTTNTKSFKREESVFSAYYQNSFKNINNKNTNDLAESHKLSSNLFPGTNPSSFAFNDNNDLHFKEHKSNQKTFFFAKRETSMHKRKHIFLRLKEEIMNPIQLIDTLKKSEKETKQGITWRIINKYNIAIGVIAILNIIFSIIDLNLNMIYSFYLINDNTNASFKPIDRLQLLQNRSLSIEENGVRIVNVILVFITIVSIVLKSKCFLSFYKRERQLNWFEVIRSIPFLFNFLFEIIVALIIYPPGVNKQHIINYQSIVYSLNVQNILFLLNLLKIVFVVRLFTIYNSWNNQIAKAICLSYHVAPGFLFSIRSCIKHKPLLFLSVTFLCVLLISESIIRSIEYSVIDDSLNIYEKPFEKLDLFRNVIWYIICRSISFTYSKYHSQTYEGQVIITILSSILWIIICIIIIKFTSQLELTTDEKKVYLKIKKLTNGEKKQSKAANVISELLILKKLIIENKGIESKKEKTKNLMHIFALTLLLNKDAKNLIDDQKISRCLSVPVDDLLKSFEKKQIDNVQILNNALDKTNTIMEDLESLVLQQEDIIKDLNQLKNIQNTLANFFMNNHNTLFVKNERNKTIEEIKINFSCHKSIKLKKVKTQKCFKKFSITSQQTKECILSKNEISNDSL